MEDEDGRAVNGTDEFGHALKWAKGAARCVDENCPHYWKNQGGIEMLVPSQGYVPTAQRAVSVILKPQEL
jgi:hypothetical protein